MSLDVCATCRHWTKPTEGRGACAGFTTPWEERKNVLLPLMVGWNGGGYVVTPGGFSCAMHERRKP